MVVAQSFQIQFIQKPCAVHCKDKDDDCIIIHWIVIDTLSTWGHIDWDLSKAIMDVILFVFVPVPVPEFEPEPESISKWVSISGHLRA